MWNVIEAWRRIPTAEQVVAAGAAGMAQERQEAGVRGGAAVNGQEPVSREARAAQQVRLCVF